MRMLLSALLAVALIAAVSNQAYALKLSNADTGQVYFFENGWENDTVGSTPDNTEVGGPWDSSGDHNTVYTTDNATHPAGTAGSPGSYAGDRMYQKGVHTGGGRTTNIAIDGGPLAAGTNAHLEFILFLRDEDGGGNSTNSFPWGVRLTNSQGDVVAGLANGWTPARPVASSTNLTLTGAGGPTADDVGEVFDDGEWVKFDMYITPQQSLTDPAGTPNAKVFLKSDRVGRVGPMFFSTGANATGDIAGIQLIDDDRPNMWFLDWPEPGTLGLLSIGGLLMLKRRRKA